MRLVRARGSTCEARALLHTQCACSAHAAHTQRTRSAHAAHTQRTRSARAVHVSVGWVDIARRKHFCRAGPCPSASRVFVLGGGLETDGFAEVTHSPADSPTHHPLSWSNRVDGTTQRRPRRGRQHRFQRRVPRPRRAERRERARRARLVAAPRALRASPLGLTLLGECTGRTQQGSRPPPLAGPPARVPTLPIARRPFLTPLFSVLSPVTSAPITPQAS